MSTNRTDPEDGVQELPIDGSKTEIQRRVEASIRDERVTIPLGTDGVEVDFRTMARPESEYTSMLTNRLESIDGDRETVRAEFGGELDRIYGMLGDLSTPEFADRDWWEEYASVSRAVQLLNAVMMETTPESLDAPTAGLEE